MRLIPRFLRRNAETRGITASADAMQALFGSTVAGVTVGPQTAMGLPTISACVRVLSETIGSLPLIVYERTNDGKRRATEHPFYGLLHDSPNRLHTSYQWRELSVGQVLLWGNCYTYIGNGELIPLKPWAMRVEVKDGEVRYIYRLDSGGERTIRADDLIHIAGLGYDGVSGLSVISAHRQAVGLGIAMETFGAGFFANGMAPGGVLTHPGRLDPKARTNLRTSFEERHKGPDKAGNLMLLEEGVKWEQVGIPAKDAQYLESRKFQAEEYCRMFRVQPSMVGIQSNMPRANHEQEALDFVVHTIRPWLVRFEQAINRRLFAGSRFYAEFLVDGLLRGDTLSRFQSYAIGRQNGWLSANDIRRLENMNPIEDGDEYLRPANMVPAGTSSATPTPANPAPTAGGSGRAHVGNGQLERITVPGRIWVE